MKYAIFTDYSGVTAVRDGKFATRREALEALVEHLTSKQRDTAANLRVARRALRHQKIEDNLK